MTQNVTAYRISYLLHIIVGKVIASLTRQVTNQQKSAVIIN